MVSGTIVVVVVGGTIAVVLAVAGTVPVVVDGLLAVDDAPACDPDACSGPQPVMRGMATRRAAVAHAFDPRMNWSLDQRCDGHPGAIGGRLEAAERRRRVSGTMLFDVDGRRRPAS